ncbi:MAG: heavy metal transport/detoxification protein [Arcobacter sp.]|nr:MAG: heavy metal transport/detoxification protein [Arcobacter sp.]
MRKLLLAIFIILLNISVFAAEMTYKMRVDGLACLYCAYGIEKKFKAIEGVNTIDIDLKKGLVLVSTDEKVKFTEGQMTTLFQDSGFTFRSMAKTIDK